MVHEGLHAMPLDELDLVFVENVGNLVCPASYDVGTHLNVVLLSVPEGDDKPAKYPVMFRSADVLLITKCDLLPHFDFDVKHAIAEARKLNPKMDIIEVDSKSGKGIDTWVEYLNMKMRLR
jgi:hydrogenase nickel incorporation protein HypB